MRIEFLEKIQDLTEEELDYQDRMGIEPKDKRFRWRKICIPVGEVWGIYEANDKETILQMTDDLKMTVKGSYMDILEKVLKAEQSEPAEKE